MYKIPKLKWSDRLEQALDTYRKVWFTTNTFNDYYIQKEDDLFYCYYGNGRFREFKSLDEAKDWVENTHYPDQVNKYLEKVDGKPSQETKSKSAIK